MFRKPALAAAAGLAAAIFGLSANAQEVEWKYYTYFGANDKPTQLHREFAKDIEEASGGRMKIDIYAGGELPYKAPDVLKAVATNQVQMGDVAIGFVAGDVPELNALAMPFVCTSIDKFYDKAAAAAEPYVDDVFTNRFRSVALMQWVMPPQQLWLRDPVDGIDGLKNLKIRAWNREQVQVMQRLGGSGVTITPAEVIPALQRGVVDGAFTAAVPAHDWKFYEVTDYGFMMSLTLAHQVATVNKAAFDALPADLQQLLRDKAAEWAPKYRQAMLEGDRTAREKLIEAGMTLHDVTPEELDRLRTVTRPMWNEWADQNGEMAKQMLADVSSACE